MEFNSCWQGTWDMMIQLCGNWTRGRSSNEGRGPSITFSTASSSISKDDWLLLPRHDTTRLMGHVFTALSGWSAVRPLLSQQTCKSLVCGVISCMAAAWRRSFHPCSSPALPAQSGEASQCGRDSTHVSAIPWGPRHRDCGGSSMKGPALWINH